MQHNYTAQITPETIWQHLRFDQLNRKPYDLTLAEAREIVQLARLIGQRCEPPPIIDDDPHPDGIPENPIYSRGAQ